MPFDLTEEQLKQNGYRPRAWTQIDDIDHENMMQSIKRNYLKCPKCEAVGTYKPRGGIGNRYYVCKYCGYGRNTEGEWMFKPLLGPKVWGYPSNGPHQKTPQEIMSENDLDPFNG